MIRRGLVVALLLLAPVGIRGQARFGYPPPPADTVTVLKDVPYGTAGEAKLMMDVYLSRRRDERDTTGADLLQQCLWSGSVQRLLLGMGADGRVEGRGRHPAGPAERHAGR